MGENCVLGNREDDNAFKPYPVHPKMFYNCEVRHVGCGDSNVGVLCAATPETANELPQFDFNLPLPGQPEQQAASEQADQDEAKSEQNDVVAELEQ